MKSKIILLLLSGLLVIVAMLFLAVRPVGGRMAHQEVTPTPNVVLTALPMLSSQPSFEQALCGSGTIYTSLPAKCWTADGLQPFNASKDQPLVILAPTPGR